VSKNLGPERQLVVDYELWLDCCGSQDSVQAINLLAKLAKKRRLT
jgi:hypothetical protein